METIVFASSILPESYNRKHNTVLCAVQHMMKVVNTKSQKQLVCEKCGYFFEVKTNK